MTSNKIIISSLTFFCLLFFGCPKEPQLKDLESFIRFKMERDNIPGLALLIIKNKNIVYEEGFGWADINKQVRMRTVSTFCVSSIAKSFTAIAVMQLHQKGKIEIDSSINKYLPFEVIHPLYQGEEITIKQLLTHTSSISNGPSLWRNFSDGDPKTPLEEWAQGYFISGGRFYHKEGNFERWKPGEGFLYSNGGYGLLAYLVQVVTGLPFNEYCKQNIFEPLEMSNTSFLVSEIDTNTMAAMYGFGDFIDLEKDIARKNVNVDSAIYQSKPFQLMNYSSPELGAGGLYSSASELANFLHFLINEDKFFSDSILRRDVLHQMLNPNVKNDLLPPWFMDLGMGFYSMKLDNGEPVWGHTGANPGSSTYLFFNPEIKIGAIVIANRFVDIRDLITWVFAEAFNELNDIPLKKLKKSWEQYSNKINGNDRNRRIVTIQVTPTALPPNSSVYVNGNHRFLGSWISKGIPLIKKNDGSWSKRFHFFDSTKIEFKVTRGSWYMQAVDNKGTDLVPYSLLVLNDTTLTISIENWKDIYSKEK
ncbi:MAG: hypothetical protein A2006_07120 [Ignavibacteria bacterium GWC2_35_8]|nr:MAG: hypothetical protein A2006_07120 [Ignavibacteria bacterium GWC2_35_8]